MGTIRCTRRELARGIEIPLDERTTLVVGPDAVVGTLLGDSFERSKAFALPRTLRALSEIFAFTLRQGPKKTLVVAHANPADPEPEGLTEARAKAMAAWLKGDVDAWLASYEDSTPEASRWGAREDRLMLRSLPDLPRVESKASAPSPNQTAAIPLPFNQTNRVAVWVSGGATPHTVADDPRLPGNPTTDTPQGQAGWDVGIREPYGTTVPGETPAFKRLATFLQPGMSLPDHVGGGVLQEHQIKRLAIVAHGLPGIMDADQFEAGFGLGGARPQASRSLTISRFSEYEDSLSKLRTVLARDAHVYFECCNLAANEEGERLLTKISSLWPTVFVVGSKSMIVVPAGLGRRGGQDFPGLRDSNHNEVPVPPVPKDYEELAFARDLTKLPWLSETSIHATVARNGSIIRRGTPVAAGR